MNDVNQVLEYYNPYCEPVSVLLLKYLLSQVSN